VRSPWRIAAMSRPQTCSALNLAALTVNQYEEMEDPGNLVERALTYRCGR
jgi:hypothetical protein